MNEKQLEQSKEKLNMLIGEEGLLKLDEQYPEVMQIMIPIPLVQSVLYKKFLCLPSFSDRSLLIGSRLIVPLLLHYTCNLCLNIPESIDQKISTAFHIKMYQLENNTFLALRNGSKSLLLSTVCVLHKFSQYMVKSVKLYQLDKRTIKESAILNWSDRKCENEREEQLKAFQQQIDHLSIYHHDQLKKIIETNKGEFDQFMKSTRGARTRATKLLTQKHKDLLRINHSKLIDGKVFNDAQLLLDYFNAIFGPDTMERVCATMCAQLSVWIQWMNSEHSRQQNAKHGLKKAQDKVWAEVRMGFEDFYDAIFDSDLNELEQLGYFLRELLPKAKQFIDKKLSVQNRNKLLKTKQRQKQTEEAKTHQMMAEWEQMVAEVRERAAEMQLTEEEGETEQEQWTKRMHMHKLIRIMESNPTVGEVLRDVFDQNEEAKERLINFLPRELIDDFEMLLRISDEKELKNKIENLKEKMDKENTKTDEWEKQNEEENKVNENMKRLVEEEEERVKVLREKIAARQEEKWKKRRNSEQKRKIESERCPEASKDSDEASGEIAMTAQSLVCSEDDFFNSTFSYGESSTPSPSQHSDSPSSSSCYAESPSKYFASQSPRNKSNAIKSPSSQAKWENEKLDNKLEKELANLQKFSSDAFLHFAYAQFLSNPSETKRRILDIGIFVNEIAHRLDIVAKLNAILENKAENNTFERERMKEVETFLREFKELDIWDIKTERDFEKVAGILHDLLKRTILELEGKNKANGDEEEQELGNEKEVKMVRKQLHRNKLAQVMANGAGWDGLTEKGGAEVGQNQSVKSIWDGMEEKEHSKMLKELIGTSKANLADRFREHLEGWRALAEQQRIDGKLYEQFEDKFLDKKSPSLGVTFPENTQQIYFKCSAEGIKHQQSLFTLLREKGFHEAPSANSAKAFGTLKLLISAWSGGDARLLETGSFMLGVRTTDADIDTICIMRQRFATTQAEEMEAFFGKEYCNLSQRVCEDNSLYCTLCKHSNVDFIIKTPRAYMPIIEMHFFGIDFDISLVLIPNIESIPDDPLDPTDIERMIKMVALSATPHEAMLKSLSGYLANSHILELMRNRNNRKKFKMLLWSLKIWAKSNYIYGNLFGFFNGAALSVLAAKIILWYPNCSVPFLFEHLMFILMNWKWPMPIKLMEEEEAKAKFELISWNPLNTPTALLMPIITAGNLTQNAAQNVNESTFKIIQNTIEETFVKLRMLRNSSQNSSATEKNWWKDLFPTEKFTSKYGHFVLIVCMVSFPQHMDHFCRYVERKLRFQLANFDKVLDQFVEYSHLNANAQMAKEANCPKMNAIQISHQKHFSICKRWLIGLKIKGQKREEKLDEEKRQLVNETLKKEVDTLIQRDYFRDVLKGMFQNVAIESRYFAQEELAMQWNFEKEVDDSKMAEK